MLKRVSLSQEAVLWLIDQHNFLNAILKEDAINAQVFQARLARYDAHVVQTLWAEVFEEFNRVRGKEEKGKIQVAQTGMVRDAR